VRKQKHKDILRKLRRHVFLCDFHHGIVTVATLRRSQNQVVTMINAEVARNVCLLLSSHI